MVIKACHALGANVWPLLADENMETDSRAILLDGNGYKLLTFMILQVSLGTKQPVMPKPRISQSSPVGFRAVCIAVATAAALVHGINSSSGVHLQSIRDAETRRLYDSFN